MEKTLTLQEAADILRRKVGTVSGYIRKGKLRQVPDADLKCQLVTEESVLALKEYLKSQPGRLRELRSKMMKERWGRLNAVCSNS